MAVAGPDGMGGHGGAVTPGRASPGCPGAGCPRPVDHQRLKGIAAAGRPDRSHGRTAAGRPQSRPFTPSESWIHAVGGMARLRARRDGSRSLRRAPHRQRPEATPAAPDPAMEPTLIGGRGSAGGCAPPRTAAAPPDRAAPPWRRAWSHHRRRSPHRRPRGRSRRLRLRQAAGRRRRCRWRCRGRRCRAEKRQGCQHDRHGVVDGRGRAAETGGELAERGRADADDDGEHQHLDAGRDDVPQNPFGHEGGLAEQAEGDQHEAGQAWSA